MSMMQQVFNLLTAEVDAFAKKVHPIFVALNHTWSDKKTPYVPSVDDIAWQANSCIVNLFNSEPKDGQSYNAASCGGVRASWVTWPSGALEVKLEYVEGISRSVSPQDVQPKRPVS